MRLKGSINQLTEKIIGACFKVHNTIGPGFNEKIYQNSLITELVSRNIEYKTEKEYKIHYLDKVSGSFRADLVVEDSVIVEVKAVTGVIIKQFEYQLLSYLKASGIKIGLIINFGNKSCQIKRLTV
ncbi:MAG: GxxExxY protein [Endomicrobiales bacterium]|nr:GxxExxY protein [Endomicrobiales bacterium]